MRRTLAGLAVVLLSGAGRPRYDELARVVNRNTGFAHMTRGVNMYTLIALRSCVSEADIPVLSQMLFDKGLRPAARRRRRAGRHGRGRPLADYPLTERKRRGTHGCAKK